MRPKIIFLAILSFLVFSNICTDGLARAKDLALTSTVLYSRGISAFGGELKFVRVLKDGKWWIYVYEGNVIVDMFPE